MSVTGLPCDSSTRTQSSSQEIWTQVAQQYVADTVHKCNPVSPICEGSTSVALIWCQASTQLVHCGLRVFAGDALCCPVKSTLLVCSLLRF